jgi:hypothetical protein
MLIYNDENDYCDANVANNDVATTILTKKA